MRLTSLMVNAGSFWPRPTSGTAYPFVTSLNSVAELVGDRHAGIFAAAYGANSVVLDLNEALSGPAKLGGLESFGDRSSLIPEWSLGPQWRDSLIMDIAGYADRPQGWDGFQGAAIEPSAITDAIEFIQSLFDGLPPPVDQPCSDGEVSLVWRFGACFAEISFPGDHTFYWYGTNGSDEDAGEGLSVKTGIPSGLNRIMGFELDHASPIKTSHAPIGYSNILQAA